MQAEPGISMCSSRWSLISIGRHLDCDLPIVSNKAVEADHVRSPIILLLEVFR